MLTFSKFKILQQNTTIYSHRSGSDWLSNKGAQYLTLQLRDTRRAAGSQAPPSLLHLVNTHLNASPIVDAVTEVSSAAAVALRQMHQLLTHLPPAHRLQGCLLVGDLNLQPAEVQVFVDQYAASHGARAVTTHGRLDRYVSFPEERSQLDYCLTLRGALPAKTTDEQTPASSTAVLDMTRDKLPLEKPTREEPAARGWWGEGSTRLVRDPLASDHLPILTHVRWVPSRV